MAGMCKAHQRQNSTRKSKWQARMAQGKKDINKKKAIARHKKRMAARKEKVKARIVAGKPVHGAERNGRRHGT